MIGPDLDRLDLLDVLLRVRAGLHAALEFAASAIAGPLGYGLSPEEVITRGRPT